MVGLGGIDSQHFDSLRHENKNRTQDVSAEQAEKPSSGTVAGHLAEGLHRAEIWCNACVRSVSVAIDDLPPEIPINQVWRHYRCDVCKGKKLSSRMDIGEFYDKIDAEKRERGWRW
jgi:hypothetical protein